jgi:aryl-alcohol dehydrogenase-like predicted oxidoreductase
MAQFEFSLINRRALFNGQIEACKDLGVIPLAHTPLARGLATGKYTALNPTGGKLREAKFDFQTLDPLSPIHEAQEKVSGMVRSRLLKAFNEDKQMRSRNYKMKNAEGDFNQQITTTQVAINYIVAKGAVPVPGINNAKEAEELLGCIGWGLTEDEVSMLDEACDKAERSRPSTPRKANFFFGARKRPVNLGF